MNVKDTVRVGVLLLQQFSFAELGNVIEPLFITNWLLEESRFQWRLLATEEGLVTSANGIPVAAESILLEPVDFDSVFVLASFETKGFSTDRNLKFWLRGAAGTGAVLCGIEGGTEALAAAGVLDSYRVTIHWDNFDGFSERYPDIDTCRDLYVIDGPRMSCAGGTAVLDMMFHWLRPQIGTVIFSQLQNHMMKYQTRHGSLRQGVDIADTLTNVHPVVQRAVQLMQASLEEPVPVADIARRLGVSVRQMERHFRNTLRTSPSTHYLRMRIARAHRLLQQTDMPIAQTAAATGFQSLEHFSRTYRRYYGCPPSKDRIQTIRAPSIARER